MAEKAEVVRFKVEGCYYRVILPGDVLEYLQHDALGAESWRPYTSGNLDVFLSAAIRAYIQKEGRL